MDVMSEVVQRKIILAGPQNECNDLADWLEKMLEHNATEEMDEEREYDEVLAAFDEPSFNHAYPTQYAVSRLIDMLRGHFNENSST